ncbi:MAG: DEAD/DEAH box helicase [Verrucomicrobia bacterium]|nr:DEAD/DEAH box helicase [Verrucomicrobiota bacterium]
MASSMPGDPNESELFSATAPPNFRLRVTLHHAHDWMQLDWFDHTGAEPAARLRITYDPSAMRFYDGCWELRYCGRTETDQSTFHRASIRAQLNKLKKRFLVTETDVAVCVAAADGRLAPAELNPAHPDSLPSGISPWLWLERRIAEMFEVQIRRFEEQVRRPPRPNDPENVKSARVLERMREQFQGAKTPRTVLRVRLDYAKGWIQLTWTNSASKAVLAQMRIRCTGRDELTWHWENLGERRSDRSTHHRAFIRGKLHQLRDRFQVDDADFSAEAHRFEEKGAKRSGRTDPLALPLDVSPWTWLEEAIDCMAAELRGQFTPPARLMQGIDPEVNRFLEREEKRARKEERRREELQARIQQNQQRLREEKHKREMTRQARAAAAKQKPPAATTQPVVSAAPRPETPPVPCTLDLGPLHFQDTLLPWGDLRSYFLREKAALWWVSNQSDDLLGLPYCKIERLDYQLRTALRVIGALRGRALLSDEVGLGKTIEAGLVLKEYLTRGMIRRFLILTVPSLVDQWEEELSEKFGLRAATTNQALFRSDPAGFWQQQHGIIASLHTLKQPAHLDIAKSLNWDMLIVDEAHYLRNRASQAWQAINVLPRQFLLLLTATPVQNSLEDLYNLVTLLQPGQLPSPKEFHDRFIDRQRPHQPREPEELRRLLGQVMIRNTRANAGLQLPHRRAETVMFEPEEAERSFWQSWETELREKLAGLSASQASLWGRLLLQASGSSPAAWREALKSFPDRSAAQAWSEQAPLELSWKKKSELLLPLAQGEGGVVIFTQFLQTQAVLAQRLAAAGVPTFVINGQTPPPQRQPITEQFRRQAGALILTHSGTEGRNLQFSHRLVNFDLPWNPMEIEQRIGRLHRLGQQHPVRIYNLVQAGTLQEHLLQILQEKLNLFELVVGETGLVLGDRFSSDEFAEEVFRRWRDAKGSVADAMRDLGDQLAAARAAYGQVKQLDETLFAKDYESL